MMLTAYLLPFLAALLAGTASAAVVVQVAGQNGGPPMFVTADVGSSSAFRLSVEFAATATAAPLSSPSLDAGRALANYTKTSGPNGSVGIKTSFGELSIDRDGRFEFPLVTTGRHQLTLTLESVPLPWGRAGESGVSVNVPLRGRATAEIPVVKVGE